MFLSHLPKALFHLPHIISKTLLPSNLSSTLPTLIMFLTHSHCCYSAFFSWEDWTIHTSLTTSTTGKMSFSCSAQQFIHFMLVRLFVVAEREKKSFQPAATRSFWHLILIIDLMKTTKRCGECSKSFSRCPQQHTSSVASIRRSFCHMRRQFKHKYEHADVTEETGQHWIGRLQQAKFKVAASAEWWNVGLRWFVD